MGSRALLHTQLGRLHSGRAEKRSHSSLHRARRSKLVRAVSSTLLPDSFETSAIRQGDTALHVIVVELLRVKATLWRFIDTADAVNCLQHEQLVIQLAFWLWNWLCHGLLLHEPNRLIRLSTVEASHTSGKEHEQSYGPEHDKCDHSERTTRTSR